MRLPSRPIRLPSRPIRPRPRGAGPVARRVAGAALIALAVAGCGEVTNTFTPSPGTSNVVKVMLAGQPNAFYVGLYEAQALGYFKASDIDLEIEVPSAGQDPVQVLHDGGVLVAFASTPTVLLHRNQNQPVVGIASIVDVPLPTIKVTMTTATTTGTSTTATTTGTSTTATTTGTSTTANATAATGGSPVTLTRTTPTASAAAGTTTSPVASVATVSAGTTMTAQANPTTTSTTTTTTPEPDASQWPARLKTLAKGSGVPNYDGLVVAARKGTIVDHAPLLRRFVQALARGYRAARANPVNAVQNLVVQVPSLEPSEALQLATVEAAMPDFFPSTGQIWGWQAPVFWNKLGTWMTDNKVISNPNALTDSSTNELLQGEGV